MFDDGYLSMLFKRSRSTEAAQETLDSLVGMACRIKQGDWFQNRERELGNTRPFTVVGDYDTTVMVLGTGPSGTRRYTVSRDSVML